jgi:anti-sigma B factor antagonist
VGTGAAKTFTGENGVDLQVSTQVGPACTVVRVSGELDVDTRPRLQTALQQVVDAGARQVVLDLAEVPFMDSSGLGALVDGFKSLQDRGGRLSLAAVREPVRTVLALSAVDQLVGLYDSVAAAEADLRPPPA